MAKSTPKLRARKAAGRRASRPLPHPDFPLFWHGSGRWAKKILGKLHYFGKVADDPAGKAALEQWLAQKDALLSGRKPRPIGEGLTVGGLAGKFRAAKEQQRASKEIAQSTLIDYQRVCDLVVRVFGATRLVDDLAADDFEKLRGEIAKRFKLVALGNEINRVRILFKYGYDAGLIDRPIRFGPTFKRPAKKALRKARGAKAAKMFEAAEIRALAAGASVQLRAMILLGINCGFGNADCGTLPMSALDLVGGWVSFPRPKTGVDRRCKLWPETLAALAAAIAARPKPKDAAHSDLVFLTKRGQPWHCEDTVAGPLSAEFRKLAVKLKLYRRGCGFYALRHGFETIGGETADQVAVNHVMGHADASMAGVYRERISDKRLEDVAAFVRAWLYASEAQVA